MITEYFKHVLVAVYPKSRSNAEELLAEQQNCKNKNIKHLLYALLWLLMIMNMLRLTPQT